MVLTITQQHPIDFTVKTEWRVQPLQLNPAWIGVNSSIDDVAVRRLWGILVWRRRFDSNIGNKVTMEIASWRLESETNAFPLPGFERTVDQLWIQFVNPTVSCGLNGVYFLIEDI